MKKKFTFHPEIEENKAEVPESRRVFHQGGHVYYSTDEVARRHHSESAGKTLSSWLFSDSINTCLVHMKFNIPIQRSEKFDAQRARFRGNTAG